MNRRDNPEGAPRLVRIPGPAPEDLEDALRAVVERFQESESAGFLPPRITVAWEDAAVGLGVADYQAHLSGQLSLADLASRTEVLSGAGPTLERSTQAPRAEIPLPGVASDPGPGLLAREVRFGERSLTVAWLGGLACGGLLLLALALLLLLRRSRRPVAGSRPGAAPGPAPALPPALPPPVQAEVRPPPLPLAPPPLPPPPAASRPTALYFLGGPLAGRRVPLAERMRVGREAQGNDLILEDPSVSRHHAELWMEGGALCLKDLGSSNGTRLNGLRLQGPAQVRPGDRLVFGSVEVQME